MNKPHLTMHVFSSARSSIAASLLGAILIIGLASPLEAQGIRDRLKRAAARAAGVESVLDAKEAVDAIRTSREGTEVRSALAGTWRVKYVLDQGDSVTFYLRTFEFPDVGTVDRMDDGNGQGHMVSMIATATEAELLEDWRDIPRDTAVITAGPIFVYPLEPEDSTTAERRFHAAFLAYPPTPAFGGDGARAKRFRETIERLQKNETAAFNESWAAVVAPWDGGTAAGANLRIGRDGSGRMFVRFVGEANETVELSAERVNTTAFSNEHKPKAWFFGL